MELGGFDIIVTNTQAEWSESWDPASRQVVLDGTMIAELRTIGDDLVSTLLEMFSDTSQTNLAGIHAALGDADLATLAHQAHELAGGAAYVAAASVSAHARAIERAARDGRAGDIPELLKALPAHIAAAIAALRHVEQL